MPMVTGRLVLIHTNPKSEKLIHDCKKNSRGNKHFAIFIAHCSVWFHAKCNFTLHFWPLKLMFEFVEALCTVVSKSNGFQTCGTDLMSDFVDHMITFSMQWSIMRHDSIRNLLPALVSWLTSNLQLKPINWTFTIGKTMATLIVESLVILNSVL